MFPIDNIYYARPSVVGLRSLSEQVSTHVLREANVWHNYSEGSVCLALASSN